MRGGSVIVGGVLILGLAGGGVPRAPVTGATPALTHPSTPSPSPCPVWQPARQAWASCAPWSGGIWSGGTWSAGGWNSIWDETTVPSNSCPHDGGEHFCPGDAIIPPAGWS